MNKKQLKTWSKPKITDYDNKIIQSGSAGARESDFPNQPDQDLFDAS